MKRSWFFLPDGRLRPLWRFVISIVLASVASFAAFALPMFLGVKGRLVMVVSRPLLMVFWLLVYAGMLRVFDRVQRDPLSAMGLPGGGRAVWDSLFGILLGSGMVLLTVAIIAWFGDLHVSLEAGGIRTGTLLIEVLLVLSTAAMAEEASFRGYPFQRLVEATGAGGAIAVMAALFGAVHLNNPNATTIGFLNTILIGIIFSISYLRSRTLWLPWGMHWAWNAVLGAGIGLPVSGFDMSVGIRSRTSGPLWLTGGEYGPEASVACTLAVLLGLVVILLAFHRPAESFSPPADGGATGSIQSL